MQKSGILIAASILVMLAASLFIIPSTQSKKSDNRLAVTVTTNIIADAVSNIAGDLVVLNCLMQPGVDPHSYHARLSDIQALQSSDLIFYNGLHLEGKMAGIFCKMQHIKPTYAVGDALSPEELICSEEFANIYDPHIWFDIALWSNVITFITECLCKHDHLNEWAYRKNCETYLEKLSKLAAFVQSTVSTVQPENRFIITTHDAFSYFGRAYGFNVIGLQGINLDAEPCIKNMHEVIDIICSHQIPVIFVESSLPHRSMEAIALAVRDKGHTISIGAELYSDTLGPSGSSADSYIGMIMHNTIALVRGLNPLYTMT